MKDRNILVNEILTIINMTMTDEEKYFIKDSIMFKDETLPESYQKMMVLDIIHEYEETHNYADFRKKLKERYGTEYITDGVINKKIIKGIEPIPEGFYKGITI